MAYPGTKARYIGWPHPGASSVYTYPTQLSKVYMLSYPGMKDRYIGCPYPGTYPGTSSVYTLLNTKHSHVTFSFTKETKETNETIQKTVDTAYR